jgi:hypothetical protein
VNSIQNTNKLIIWRDFHISPGCLLHNFKELYFAFGTTKLIFLIFLSKQKMRYFFRPFPFQTSLSSLSRNPISPSLQSTLCLKAGANVWNEFYNPNLYVSILINIFIFLNIFCIYLFFKPLIRCQFEKNFGKLYYIIYCIKWNPLWRFAPSPPEGAKNCFRLWNFSPHRGECP